MSPSASGPKTFAEMYVAVQTLAWGDDIFDTIRREDLGGLVKSELRALGSLVGRMIDTTTEIARAQVEDPGFQPPEGFPDVIYRIVVRDLEALQEEIEAHKPRATLRAIFTLRELGGTSPASGRAGALWDVSHAKVRELLWREELGSVDPRSLESYAAAFSDEEILRYGYVEGGQWDALLNPAPPTAWGHICNGPPLKDGRIPPSSIADAMRRQGTIVPLEIARALVRHAEASTIDDLQTKVAEELGRIDDAIVKALQSIYTNKQLGGGFEAPFLEWASEADGDSVYGLYKDFRPSP